jgi:hypothetical protein
LRGPFALNLAPGATITRTLAQRIPACVPAGTYAYLCNVGEFGVAIADSDSDSISFTKSSNGAQGSQ